MYRRFSYLKLKHLYSKVIIFVYALLIMIAILCLVASFIFTKESYLPTSQSVVLAEKKIKLNPDYNVLPINSKYCTIFEEDVKKQLKFFGKNSRPDAQRAAFGVLAGFTKSLNKSLLTIDGKYFLKYSSSGLDFSSKPTPLWIKVKGVKQEALSLELCLLLADQKNKEVFQHSNQIVIAQSPLQDEKLMSQLSLESGFERFESVKWWGVDRFFDVYGAQDPDYVKGSQRIDFKGDGSGILFLKEKDVLIWKDGMWQKPAPSDKTDKFPLASVKKVSSTSLQLMLWDVSGIFSKIVTLTPERTSPLNIRIEDTFTKLRRRTLDRITCKLSNKTIILREGDWVLKTDLGWKVLKNIDEIENYLNLAIKGELFVFDKIEQSPESSVLKGRLFDSMRTQLQTIRIPLAKQKKNNRLHSKKKPNFSKLGDSTQNISENESYPPLLEDDEDELLNSSLQ